jgi:hypothetical protein
MIVCNDMVKKIYSDSTDIHRIIVATWREPSNDAIVIVNHYGVLLTSLPFLEKCCPEFESKSVG